MLTTDLHPVKSRMSGSKPPLSGSDKRFFANTSRPDVGPTQPPVQWGPLVKWMGHDASGEVRSRWSYTSISHI
jgi:hypothetical protein